MATKGNAVSASADALDDDFELDNDLIAFNDEDEASNTAEAGPSKQGVKHRSNSIENAEDEDEFALDDEELDNDNNGSAREGSDEGAEEVDEYGLPVGRSKRQKLNGTDSENGHSKDQQKTAATAEEKKRKRKEKQKEAKRKKMKAVDEAEAEVDTSFIALQPPPLQADYLAEMLSQAMPKLSAIEAEDFRILERFLVDTSNIEDRKSIKTFVKEVLQPKDGELKGENMQNPGGPKILVVSGAALRVTDIVRDLRDLTGKGGGEVAKLFAKHFKLAEHCSYCQKTKFSIGAGTPDRILKLIEADALRLDEATHLFLDMKKDTKKRNLMDIPESRTALFKLLTNEKLGGRLKRGNLKIVLY